MDSMSDGQFGPQLGDKPFMAGEGTEPTPDLTALTSTEAQTVQYLKLIDEGVGEEEARATVGLPPSHSDLPSDHPGILPTPENQEN